MEDPIVFHKSIKVFIEHGHANGLANDYSSVAYWYQTAACFWTSAAAGRPPAAALNLVEVPWVWPPAAELLWFAKLGVDVAGCFAIFKLLFPNPAFASSV